MRHANMGDGKAGSLHLHLQQRLERRELKVAPSKLEQLVHCREVSAQNLEAVVSRKLWTINTSLISLEMAS